jgi:hypothetical protein
MAARLNRNHSEQVLERIRLSNLVTRLQKNALRQLRNPNDNSVVSMTEGEIRSAIFLIERKLAKAEAPKDLNVNGTLNIAWPLPKSPLDQ